jgi:hypothetical protein
MAASIFPASFVICAAREAALPPLLTSSWRIPDLSGCEAELPLLDTERNDGEANVTDTRCTGKLHKPFLIIRSLRSTSRPTRSKHNPCVIENAVMLATDCNFACREHHARLLSKKGSSQQHETRVHQWTIHRYR